MTDDTRAAGAEEPLEHAEPAAELGVNAYGLSLEDQRRLVNAYKERDLAKRLPDDLKGVGTRR